MIFKAKVNVEDSSAMIEQKQRQSKAKELLLQAIKLLTANDESLKEEVKEALN